MDYELEEWYIDLLMKTELYLVLKRIGIICE